MEAIRAAVLTVSDRCWRGEAVDTSGPALVQMLRERLAAEVVATACVPDEVAQISEQLEKWATGDAAGEDAAHVDLVLTTGGTGLGPRDVTPEATLPLLDRQHLGLMQLVYLRCWQATPRVFLSRGVAGTISRTLVINLPGSRRGATESLEALLDVLPHAIETMRGGDHPPESSR